MVFAATLRWQQDDNVYVDDAAAAEHVAAQVVLASDLNCDGVVDGADLGLFLTAWSEGDLRADLDRDGQLTNRDLGMLLANWFAATD